MWFRLLVMFVTVPFLELALLLWIAHRTSLWFTLGLIIATGLVGSLLARSQGVRAFRRIQQELSRGQMPGEAMLDAVLIFVAGLLLITPGVITDLIGITLLIPPCRAYYRQRLLKWLRSRFVVHTVQGASWESAGGGSQVIDVEAFEVRDTGEDAPGKRLP